MTDSDDTVSDELPANEPVPGIGAQLRAAREQRGLTLDQVAAQTRISRRHLQHLEEGKFDALPGRTYAVGFARTLARSVGLDESDVVAMVRAELDAGREAEGALPGNGRGTFEPGDPARAPGGNLVWFSLLAIVILLIGIFFAARALLAPAADLPSLVEQSEAQQASAQAAQQSQAAADQRPVDPAGAVVFTAQGDVWARFYDEAGRVLHEGTMAEGQSFTVPADAAEPQIITGRPDLLTITVGGRQVRRLADTVVTLSDVPISAEALLARPPQVAPSAAAQSSGQSSGQSSTASSGAPTSGPSPAATAPPRAIEANPRRDGVSPVVN